MSFAEFTVTNPIHSDKRSPARWILSHLLHNKLFIVVMVAGAFGNAALAAATPVLVGMAFDSAEANDLRGIGLAAIAILVGQIVRAVLQFGRNGASATLGERLERDTRQELYTSLLGKSMTFHYLQPVGDTMARATGDVREMNLMIYPGINLIIGSANFILLPIILAPSYHPHLLFAPLFFTTLYTIALYFYLRTLSPIADDVRGAFGKLNSRLAEAIDGIETVKGAAQEQQEINLFHKLASAYRNRIVDQGRVEAWFLPLLLMGVTTAIAFAHSIWLFQQPDSTLTVGDIVAYIGLISLFGFPTFVSLFAYSAVARGMASARRILSLIETKTELDQNRGGKSGEIIGRIQFNNVSAGYLEDVNVLENISFTVEPGQTIAIVGQTGSGKSSLVKLLNRTYDVRAGSVTIDGHDVRDWDLAALRQQISIIEQDIFLFSRSIAENIAFGKPTATRAEIVEAAQSAQAHEFIETFADQYDTVIGERGVTLSGGQRQRLALARAFLTEPRILVLDDSTSAVDSATEDKIQRAIAQAAARQTTFLITHRLSQIRWADVVVLLRKGNIVAVGNHDSLMQDYPVYRRIFEQYQD